MGNHAMTVTCLNSPVQSCVGKSEHSHLIQKRQIQGRTFCHPQGFNLCFHASHLQRKDGRSECDNIRLVEVLPNRSQMFAKW